MKNANDDRTRASPPGRSGAGPTPGGSVMPGANAPGDALITAFAPAAGAFSAALTREKLGPLRVLVLEDSARDAELAIRELDRFGYEPRWTRVDTEAAFRANVALAFDLILAVFLLPKFCTLASFRVLRDCVLRSSF